MGPIILSPTGTALARGWHATSNGHNGCVVQAVTNGTTAEPLQEVVGKINQLTVSGAQTVWQVALQSTQETRTRN